MKLRGVDLLDGGGWRRGVDIDVVEGRIAAIRGSTVREGAPVVCPAPLDLQVNGGGGRMLGDCESPGDVLEILAAHRRLGTGGILPTLISDTPRTTARVVRLIETAQRADSGILGLHLEGPHIAMPGAHDPALLRDMTAEDVALAIAAKARVGALMITLAPERATTAQIAELARAGIIVSLGHTACTCEAAEAAFAAGARMATHLYNAMSGLHHRAPGLVGAALTRADVYGLIPDGHHVADAALKVALAAHPEGAIPVSDAMAVTGTNRRELRPRRPRGPPKRRPPDARRRDARGCRYQPDAGAPPHRAGDGAAAARGHADGLRPAAPPSDRGPEPAGGGRARPADPYRRRPGRRLRRPRLACPEARGLDRHRAPDRAACDHGDRAPEEDAPRRERGAPLHRRRARRSTPPTPAAPATAEATGPA
jgi:N-acetylglucosamine-6-phosphate deacetylase